MDYRTVIPIEVRGDHIYSDRASIGAVGSQNTAILDVVFDDSWSGLVPTIFWFSAMDYETQVAETVLTSADKVEDLHYKAVVPHAIYAYEGTAAFVIEGTATVDSKDIFYPTEYGKLIVKASSNEVQDIDPEDDPMSILQQVQNLENLASASKTAAAESASSASTSASSASASATAAGTSASNASTYAGNASASASSASGYSSSASAAAQRAEQMAAEASANASASASASDAASASASASASDAASASASASAASASASAAGRSASNASASASAAASDAASASASAASASNILSDIEEKESTFGAALSEHTNNSDIHVTAEDKARWDAGGGGGGGSTTDVKINGTSIVVDNVANIPLATSSVLGVIKTTSNYGASTTASGSLVVVKASNSEIDTRNGGSTSRAYKPIVPNSLDYAVKSALCDGKGAVYSDDEKSAARLRFGISDPDDLPTENSDNSVKSSGIYSYVNSSVSTATAYFIGTFNSVDILNAYEGTKTINDYAFVKGTDSAGNAQYNRYKWDGSQWLFEYTLNNSSFTANQWATINSGLTANSLSGKENTSNKVTAISADSTDTQYPSAKAVYTLIGDIESALSALR